MYTISKLTFSFLALTFSYSSMAYFQPKATPDNCFTVKGKTLEEFKCHEIKDIVVPENIEKADIRDFSEEKINTITFLNPKIYFSREYRTYRKLSSINIFDSKKNILKKRFLFRPKISVTKNNNPYSNAVFITINQTTYLLKVGSNGDLTDRMKEMYEYSTTGEGGRYGLLKEIQILNNEPVVIGEKSYQVIVDYQKEECC